MKTSRIWLRKSWPVYVTAKQSLISFKLMVCGLVVLTILNFSNLIGYRSGSPDLNVDRYVQYFCPLYHSWSTQTVFFLSLSIFIFCRFKVRWLKRTSVLHGDIPGCFGWSCTAETLEPLAYYQTVLSGILQPYTRLGTRLINYFPWMIPYSRRRFSDFFSLTQLKLPWKHHPS